MRKISIIFILAGLLCTGCYHNPDPELPATSSQQTDQPVAGGMTSSSRTSIPRPSQSTASEQTRSSYFTDSNGDLVNSNRQVTRETLGRSASRNFSPGATSSEGVVVGGYVNEKQAMNYHVASGATAGTSAVPPVRSEYAMAAPWKVVTDKSPTKVDEATPVESDEVPFKAAIRDPLSTFSADVDTASFANVRREIYHGVLPSPKLVRVEEMLNYFQYDLPEPESGHPFSVSTELSDCPWSAESKLMRVAIKTKSIDRGDEPPRNLVFLLDVSGSMNSSDKLPLLKGSLRKLVDTLDDNDRVAIVVYAGSSGLVLPSTTGNQKTTILEAIDRLSAGGSTNGAQGIQLAYEVADANKSEDSVNRVILATDGDFNVGISSPSALKTFIEEKRESGLFLSVLGFGRGGNDSLMETLADNGNGNYASIDTLNEARKVLVQQVGATLITVAKDVKFQVAFDPKYVESYRLIGYKNRRLAARDFNDDTKDAGELGAGHAVTALYELRMKPSGPERALLAITGLNQPAVVKLRYKAPDADKSTLMEVPVSDKVRSLDKSTPDHQWAAAVAGYGMLLTKELPKEQMPFDKLASLMKPTMSSDPDAYQSEFYSMVKKTESML